MARPWISQTTAVSCRSVVIPYSIVGYDPSRDPAYSRLPDYSPRTAMLLAAMAALFESGKDLDLEEAEALSEGFAALVRRLLLNLGDRCPEAGPTDGNALFIRRFIDERLSDPDLTPQRLCDALRISRASLYRMFSEEGGVHSYITSRRLERCFHELHQARPQRGRVRTIAERWGFFDPPSFTRSFRRRFGITPLECMEASIDGDSQAGASAHPVQDWLKRP
jgi:AraC-like DNA-binding protein